MTRHFDEAAGLCEKPDLETQQYMFGHTMMRIKDPLAGFLYPCPRNEINSQV